MSSPLAIKIEGLSKQYRLGMIGRATLGEDLNRWWARVRGKPDPTLRVDAMEQADASGHPKHIWALQDVNLEVRKGEVLGIIGGNGSGKSTLLKLLSRVTAPTAGNIKLKGSVASLLEVGTGFHPELTGRENIYLNGAILGMNRAEVARKIDRIIAFSAIEKYIDTPVKRYSSGMYVRLAFSVAAHLEADILLVDEVLAVGDAQFQKRCVGKMRDVAGHGRTVLFVSHNMSLVESLCDRVICLQDGQIAGDGAAEPVIQEYIRAGDVVRDSCSVRDIERKTTGGRPWFEEVKLLNKEEQPATGVGVGEALHVELSLRAWKDLADPRIAIGINDPFGRRMCTVRTDLDPEFSWSLKDGEGVRVRCTIPENVLMPGGYTLTLLLVDTFEVLDNVERICPFDVVSRDFFGTGRELHPNQGVFVCRTHWSVCR